MLVNFSFSISQINTYILLHQYCNILRVIYLINDTFSFYKYSFKSVGLTCEPFDRVPSNTLVISKFPTISQLLDRYPQPKLYSCHDFSEAKFQTFPNFFFKMPKLFHWSFSQLKFFFYLWITYPFAQI